MKIKAILFGGSGMVGEGVLIEALKHEQVESALVIGRRSCNITHHKLKEILHDDFFDYSKIEQQLKGYNACFFCLGVSSVGMNEQDYTRTTYDLTMAAAATLSRLNPDMAFCFVSGTGTNAESTIMWARVKGTTEEHLRKLPFKAVYAFRPGLMKPNVGQKNVKTIFKVLSWPYPIWKLLFPGSVCTLEDLGRAMIHAVGAGHSKHVLENKDITQIGRAAGRG